MANGIAEPCFYYNCKFFYGEGWNQCKSVPVIETVLYSERDLISKNGRRDNELDMRYRSSNSREALQLV